MAVEGTVCPQQHLPGRGGRAEPANGGQDIGDEPAGPARGTVGALTQPEPDDDRS